MSFTKSMVLIVTFFVVVLCMTMGIQSFLYADGVLTAPAGPGVSQSSATRPDSATAVGHSHTTGATITLTPTAGQFVYVTGLDISNCQTTTGVTPAAPTYITTTNITGAPQYQLGTGALTAPGTCTPTSVMEFSTPVRSAAVTTAVTFVLPAFATNQVVSVNVYWYSAP
jgi:hypothetical protein